MADLILATLLQHLSNLLARPYKYETVRAIRESEMNKLRNELDLLSQWTEMDEIAGLIGTVLDKYDLAAPELINNMRNTGNLISILISNGNINRNIENIKELLVKITETEKFNGGARGINVFASHPEEELVGRDDAAKKLAEDHLLGEEPRRLVTTVLGGMGIGKTALVSATYNSQVILEQFEICTWVPVPKGSRIKPEIVMRLTARKLLRDEAIKWREMYGDWFSVVRRFLTGKKYLLVFDDMWDTELWYVVCKVLPDDGNKSRVIVTTRNVSVSAFSKHIYKVEPLSEEALWKLFCRTAFGEDICPEQIMEASAEILGICEGLPGAIMALVDYLWTKSETPSKWSRLLGNFSLEDVPGLVALSNSIEVGFDDLPLFLKLCFMYFSIFPKKSEIRNEKLMRLWIADGFLHEYQEKTLEEVAEECLNKLVEFNLVRVCEGFYGIDEFCRVHNLMHEMVRRKARSHDFCVVSHGKSLGLGSKSQRMIISSDDDLHNALDSIKEFQVVRSVFLWNSGPHNDSVLVRFFQKYYFLTMLDIENCPLDNLPNEVGYLSSLNYLSLKNTRIRKLPSTIGMLSKLEFLDISGGLLIELPIEIVKLTRLRHLQVSHEDGAGMSMISSKGVKIVEGIGQLTNLQTLTTVEASLSGKDMIRELKKLKQLKSLGISRLTASLSKAIFASIREMRHLKSLSLTSMSNETLDLQMTWFPLFPLERLVIKGKLRSLPIWISFLDHLRMMCLSHSNLAGESINRLCRLPNLESLWLYGAYRGPRLTFKTGFKKLKLLALREMLGLEVIEIAEATMPLLEELRIGPSPLLKGVPTGVASLKRLKVLSFYDMPDKFVLSLQPKNVFEFPEVHHVPSIIFQYRFGSGRNYISLHLGDPELLHSLNNGGFDKDPNYFRWRDSRRSFSYSEGEGETTMTSSFRSGQISFFSDDIED